MTEQNGLIASLECSWCGATAITSDTGEFQEDEIRPCRDCGMPGHVVFDGENGQDGPRWFSHDWNDMVVADWVKNNPIAAEEMGYGGD